MEPSQSSVSSSSSIRSPQVSLVTMPFSSALLKLLVTGMKAALCAVVLGTTPDTEATGSSAAWVAGSIRTCASVHPRPSELQLAAFPFN